MSKGEKMKRLMFLVAMMVMTAATAVPALAQTGQEVPASGSDGATLFTLGVGILLITCGFLVRRLFGKS